MWHSIAQALTENDIGQSEEQQSSLVLTITSSILSFLFLILMLIAAAVVAIRVTLHKRFSKFKVVLVADNDKDRRPSYKYNNYNMHA